jgi:hypothetical protein
MDIIVEETIKLKRFSRLIMPGVPIKISGYERGRKYNIYGLVKKNEGQQLTYVFVTRSGEVETQSIHVEEMPMLNLELTVMVDPMKQS